MDSEDRFYSRVHFFPRRPPSPNKTQQPRAVFRVFWTFFCFVLTFWRVRVFCGCAALAVLIRSQEMKIQCPYEDCPQNIELDISYAGTEINCPTCNRPFSCPEFNSFPLHEQGVQRKKPSVKRKREISESDDHLNPNRSTQILLLGIFAWIIGILGLIALGNGIQDLQEIKNGWKRSKGKGKIIFGMISGTLGFVVNLSIIITRCVQN